ncbi:cysteine proteinase [Serendipita vermifera]|nr:cysteine proteinase [Serendipita vermifera]
MLPAGDNVETSSSGTAGTAKTAKPAPLVKSFASLLRPSPWTGASKPPQDGGIQVNTPKSSEGTVYHSSGVVSAHTEQSSSNQSRLAIPTSSQVGFSVPALDTEDKEHHLLAALAPRQHANLLQLLKSGTSLVSRGNEPGTAPSLKPHIIPRGLVNTGNICFANAILQALVYTPPLWRLFDELGKSGLITERQARDTPITAAVIGFINEFKPKSGPGPDPMLPRNSFKATDLYSSLRSNARFDAMRLGQQEDAEEFLGFFLDSLHEECCRLLNLLGDTGSNLAPPQPGEVRSDLHDTLSGDNTSTREDDDWQEVGKRNRAVVTRTMKSTESAITSIFGGKFRSVLRASGRPDSASIEEWRCLQLDIQPPHIKTIEDALHSVSTIETVSIQSRQGISVEATKQMLIEQLPPILILHLKRFVYDPITGIGKNTKTVRFGPDLDIRSDLLSPNGRRGQVQRYKLYGVVYHHGLQATGGHYTLDVLHPNPLEYLDSSTKESNKHNQQPSSAQNNKSTSDERWVRFNDEVVRLLTPENLFGRTGAWGQELVDDARMDSREDKAAYLLLYRRVLK